MFTHQVIRNINFFKFIKKTRESNLSGNWYHDVKQEILTMLYQYFTENVLGMLLFYGFPTFE